MEVDDREERTKFTDGKNNLTQTEVSGEEGEVINEAICGECSFIGIKTSFIL